MLTTFDDLVNECLKTGIPIRLLYVYVKMPQTSKAALQGQFPEAPTSDAGGIGCSIAFDAHEPVKPGLTFAGMLANADAHNPDWDIVFVGMAKGRNGSPPTDAQANRFLADMTQKIVSGAIPPNAPIFDRSGRHMSVIKMSPSQNMQPGDALH